MNLIPDELKNFLNNKKVVIIGPSPELALKNKSKFFDSFDIICSVNDTYILDDNYGSHIDILFNTTNNNALEYLKKNENNFISKNIKYLLGTNKINTKQNKDNWESYCEITKKYNNKLNIYNIEDFTNYIDNIVKQPSHFHTGIFALTFLLLCNLKELYIDGFTFYNNGKFGQVSNKKYHLNGFLESNTHVNGCTVQEEIEFINNLISNVNFPVNFDETYCPLNKNIR